MLKSWRAIAVSLLCGAALTFGAAGPAAAAAADSPLFAPVLAKDFADPFVLPLDDGWVAYATNPDRARLNVPVAISTDLTHWDLAPGEDGKGERDAMPELPPWAKKGWTWAPEVMRLTAGYVLYFTAKDRKSELQCIGTATSKNPLGPFTSSAEAPLVCQKELGGSIDASPFRDSDGQLWLYYKNDGNAAGKPVQIWAQKLAPDGLSVTGEPAPILKVDAEWENGVIEAPTMVRHDGRYFLFFSASYYGWNGDQRLSPYAMGYATCSGPAGPCKDAPDNPILHSFASKEGCLSGPGHQSVFESGGRSFITFHAWSATPGCRPLDPMRYLYLSPLLWKDGKPAIGVSLRPK